MSKHPEYAEAWQIRCNQLLADNEALQARVRELEGALITETKRRERAEEKLSYYESAIACRTPIMLRGGKAKMVDREKVAQILAERNTLRAENERMREALEFYADRGHWIADYGCTEHSSRATEDCGDKARAALVKPEGGAS